MAVQVETKEGKDWSLSEKKKFDALFNAIIGS